MYLGVKNAALTYFDVIFPPQPLPPTLWGWKWENNVKTAFYWPHPDKRSLKRKFLSRQYFKVFLSLKMESLHIFFLKNIFIHCPDGKLVFGNLCPNSVDKMLTLRHFLLFYGHSGRRGGCGGKMTLWGFVFNFPFLSSIKENSAFFTPTYISALHSNEKISILRVISYFGNWTSFQIWLLRTKWVNWVSLKISSCVFLCFLKNGLNIICLKNQFVHANFMNKKVVNKKGKKSKSLFLFGK